MMWQETVNLENGVALHITRNGNLVGTKVIGYYKKSSTGQNAPLPRPNTSNFRRKLNLKTFEVNDWTFTLFISIAIHNFMSCS